MTQRQKITLNETAAAATDSYSRITMNLAPSIRHERMQGRDYIVAPMVMITEGVHNGSNGPLYYPKATLAKTPVIWNTKPVVVYHPSMNGEGISACDQDVLERQQVGMIMNTRYDNGKLRAEAWLEEDRLRLVDERVLTALEAGTMMEVSTGLFTDNEYDPGSHGGKDYELVANNPRPDHLALLPDKIGACSIAAGAGLLQLNALADDAGIDMERLEAIARADTARVVANVISHSETFNLLITAIQGLVGSDAYVADVYDKFLIYEHGRTLFRHDYTRKKATVALVGSPEPVTRTVMYRTAGGGLIGNTNPTAPKEQMMTKKELVGALIANEGTAWTAADETFLMEQNEDALAKFAPTENKAPPFKKKDDDEDDDAKKKAAAAKAKTDNEAAVAAAAATGAAELQPTGNAAPQAITLDQLPPEMRAVYNHGAATLNAERATVINAITANASNVFTPEQLAAKPIDELKQISALAGAGAPVEPTPHYGGAAGGAPNQNAEAGDTEPLRMPTMNFEAETAGV